MNGWKWQDDHPKLATAVSVVLFWGLVIVGGVIVYTLLGLHGDPTACPVGGLAGC